MTVNYVDATKLSESEIRKAFIYDGTKFGSNMSWVAEQIEKALRDRAGITAYYDESGTLRAHYKAPEHRRRP